MCSSIQCRHDMVGISRGSIGPHSESVPNGGFQLPRIPGQSPARDMKSGFRCEARASTVASVGQPLSRRTAMRETRRNEGQGLRPKCVSPVVVAASYFQIKSARTRASARANGDAVGLRIDRRRRGYFRLQLLASSSARAHRPPRSRMAGIHPN